MIEFRVNGIPKGQPRPRAFARGGHAAVYDPGTAEGWKSDIAMAAKPHIPATPLAGAVKLTIDFLLPRPKRLCRKNDPCCTLPAMCKPDLDNFCKAVMDCLTRIGMWQDDAQVVKLDAMKHYHAIGDRPGAVVKISYESDGID